MPIKSNSWEYHFSSVATSDPSPSNVTVVRVPSKSIPSILLTPSAFELTTRLPGPDIIRGPPANDAAAFGGKLKTNAIFSNGIKINIDPPAISIICTVIGAWSVLSTRSRRIRPASSLKTIDLSCSSEAGSWPVFVWYSACTSTLRGTPAFGITRLGTFREAIASRC